MPQSPQPAPPTRSRTWIVVAAVALATGLVLAGIWIAFAMTLAIDDGLPPPTEGPLRIGTVMSITGALAAFGSKNRQGVILAAEEINAAGGVLSHPIQLYHQNDDTRPDTARAAAATLISQDRVAAILGATGSGQCSTVLEVAKANGVFEVSGSCVSPRFSNLTFTGGWFARTAPSDTLQGVVAASYARSNLTFTRAGAFAINNAYGPPVAQRFADTFVRLGGTLTANSPRIIPEAQPGPVDYTSDLHSVLDTNPQPQIVYVVAFPPEGLQLMRNWQAGLASNPGWRLVRWLFSEGVYDQASFLDPARLGMDGVPGTADDIDTTGWQGTAPAAYADVRGPLYAAWSSAYSTRWGSAPGLFDDNYYDAAYLVALAAQASGSTTGAGIKSRIHQVANPPGVVIRPGEWAKALVELGAGRDIDYEGGSGAVNLDGNGDPLGAYVVWGVDAGGRAVTQEVFPESLVVSLLPAPPAPVPPAPKTRVP